jgi:tetratricopeptide (TPR) repeat protein
MDKTKIFEAAGKFASKGQLDKAAKEYQRILEEDPKDVRALQKLAEIYQKTGKPREATDLMLQVADGYTEQGFFLKAVAVYKQILKVGNDRIEVNQKLAQLYQQLGLVGDATQQYQLVANHFDRQGNIKESLAALRRMVELDPDNVASQVKLGELYARERMIPEAVAELRKAAVYLKQNNRHDDYLRVLDRIGQIAADDAQTARELAQNYLALGDTKRALAKLQICFKQNPKDIETLHLLARAFIALDQEPKAVSVYRELARVHEERGETNDYRQALERILEISPEDPDAATALRELNARVGPPSVLAPPPPRAIPSAASAREPARPAAPAQPRVRQQRPLGPNVPPNVVKILTETDVYLKYGLVVKAADHVRGALIEAPDCIEAHEKALLVYERQNKQEDVTRELVRLVELSRDRNDRDRLNEYTQELGQRDPDHPLVLAAAAAADLPAIDDDVVIETDDEEGVIVVQPEDLDEGIEISTEATVPPPAPPVRERTIAPWDRIVEDEEAILIEGDASEPSGAPAYRNGIDLGDEDSLGAAIDRATGAHSRVTNGLASFGSESDDEAVVVPDDDLPPMPDSDEVVTSSVEVSAAHTFLAEGRSSGQLDALPALEALPLEESLEEVPEAAIADESSPPFDQEDAEDDFAEEFAEAEFLVQQGLEDDARNVLEGILLAAPDHWKSVDLLNRLNGTEQPAEADSPFEEAPETASEAPGEAGFNLAGELADEFDKMIDARVTPPPESAHSVKDVLAEFKQRLSATVSAEDSQTHYDLGIAYKEMGLYDEAIHEFEVALQGRGRMRVIDCLTMLGVCRLEKGDVQGALGHFEQALKTPGLTLEASKEAHYEIGHCQELLGEERSALDHYARVYKADSHFRDVKVRVARLSQKLRGAASGSHAAVGNGVGTPAAKESAENTGPRGTRGKIGYI